MSAGDVLRVDKDGLIMESIGIFRDRGELNIILLLGDFWINEEVEFVVGGVVVAGI